MKIIVGLGNPGEQYKNTRHNIGWLMIDYLLGEVAWQENKKFSALTYDAGGDVFVKPLTFMNNSGQAVQKILDYYKLRPKKLGFISKKDQSLNEVLTVIHDDLDLDFGTSRLATDSGSAGHRGVQSIINQLKTKKFNRLRLGIKTDLLKTHVPPDKFVTQPFTKEEREKLTEIFSKFTLQDL
ncbi:MAG: aminoacyl-tRNA hydrolase [Patescibacteria group bacterium]|jgi:PTH1 family peptidyl-tRNA hydrolase